MVENSETLKAQALHRAAILHAASAWGSEDGMLIEALVRRIEELEKGEL